MKVNELKKEKDRSYLLSKYVLSATLALAGLWFIDISMSGELERMYSYLPANVFHAGMRSMLFFFTTSSLILSIVFWIQGMVYSYKISKIIST
ncbi:MAG: hypothetical protein DRO00_03375 [Thermoproteota archaeon]|nr:MAG: hypothetical protein DRO00_03375 [Candidatus Korarchaeota archaeon]